MKRTSALVALLLFALALTPSITADHNPTHADVNNRPPQVTYTDAPQTVTPQAGGERLVEITLEVFEPNGWQDIQRVEVTVYKPDNSTVHRQFDATPTGPGTGPYRQYHGEFTMDFWDAPAPREPGYVIKTVAKDHPGSRSDPAYHSFAYEQLTAMALGSQQLQFPEKQPGETSDPVAVEIRNVGNVPLGLEVAGSPLVSPEGHEIPESNLRVDTDSQGSSNGTHLSQQSTKLGGFHLPPGPDSRQATWWTLTIPTGDTQYVPAGEYAGSISLDAVQEEGEGA